MYTTQQRSINSIFVLIDFKKVFDSISWDFLYSTWDYYYFLEGFIKYNQVLNNDIFVSVIQCGALSEFFRSKEAAGKGIQLPHIFFILAGNILNLLINSNKNVSGIISASNTKLTSLLMTPHYYLMASNLIPSSPKYPGDIWQHFRIKNEYQKN